MTQTRNELADRLADALRELMCQRGVKLYAEGFVQERALTALADFDRTAAQEANVQGGEPYAQFGNDGVLRVDVQRLVDEGIYAKHAAPHPTPAPASGEVTDAMVRAALDSYAADWRSGTSPSYVYQCMRAALEAATRARQGEGGTTDGIGPRELWIRETGIPLQNCIADNGARVFSALPPAIYKPEEWVRFREVIPNAADAEAYRAQGEAVAWKIHPETLYLVKRFSAALAEKLAAAEKKYGYSDNWARPGWADECRAKLREHVEKGDPRDVAAYCAFLWHHNESTAAPNAAPVPADEGEKK